MASNNVTDLAKAAGASKTGAARFAASHVEEVFRNVAEARAICRVVALANDGMMDGAVQFDDSPASRWEPSIDQACGRVRAVRDVLIETSCAPDCNWWTSLNLLEALGASMWHCLGPGNDKLDHVEMASFMCIVIEALDSLIGECEGWSQPEAPN